ncbi:MAG: MotA/TolQ/ExbB proton channel family protein [Sinimarinibacterium sp.]
MLDLLLAPFTAVSELVESGGPVVEWILISCIVMWTLVIERYWYFRYVLPRQADAMLKVWEARPEHDSWIARQIRQKMISQLNVAMNANMPMLRVLVPMAPLLGLLGTVTGMLAVFDAMAARGSADARTMADGVSEAMICTLSGLAVSITGLFPVHRFVSRVRRETELLADKFTY